MFTACCLDCPCLNTISSNNSLKDIHIYKIYILVHIETFAMEVQ